MKTLLTVFVTCVLAIGLLILVAAYETDSPKSAGTAVAAPAPQRVKIVDGPVYLASKQAPPTREPTLPLPVTSSTLDATTPYPGPPPADTLGLCYEHDANANGTVECSPEKLQEIVAGSQRNWEVLPEWVRQDCKTYTEPKLMGCVLEIEMAWFAAHPGEPAPGWTRQWGVGDQAK